MINPAQLQKAMKRFGIQQQDIACTKVIMECSDKTLIFENPSVAKVSMGGQESWQVVGTPVEQTAHSSITEEDIKTVAEQANTTEDKARSALEKHDGDLAAAILELSNGN